VSLIVVPDKAAEHGFNTPMANILHATTTLERI